MKKLTPLARILICVVFFGGALAAYLHFRSTGDLDKLAQSVVPEKKGVQEVPKGLFKKEKANLSGEKDPALVPKDEDTIRVGVVTWGGYAGGQYFNNGFEPNTASRYQSDYGIAVKFVLIDDFKSSRDAFKAGDIDVLWATADSFPTEVESLKEYEPKVIFQADWSRGGDAVVVKRGIQSVADLKGKKIAVAMGTPSSTFLLWLLDAGDLSYKDVDVVIVNSAIDAAQQFKAGVVDAAVVWSPDDEDCVKTVKGSKVLKSTKQASQIIGDVFFVKNAYLKAHRQNLVHLIEGWMIGAAEINTSQEAKAKAAKILAAGLKQPEDFTLNAINNARLTNYGDNLNFFNNKGNYEGVKGEDLYNNMSVAYNKINQAPAKLPAWRLVSDNSLLNDVDLAGKPGQEAEGAVKFTAPSAELKSAPAVATKHVTITFPTGAAELDENGKALIQAGFGEIARSFANTRIRIEGNSDNTGNATKNQALSQKRAQAVANFLISEYHFDKNRFVIVGNGDSKPVASNDTAEGRAKNRRTDFELLGD